MSTEAIKTEEAPDYLSMSDDEISSMDSSVLPADPVEKEVVEVAEEAVETEAEEVISEAAADDAEDQEEAADVKEVPELAAEKPEVKEVKEVKPEVETSAVVDYKKEYERIFTPFKANGKEIAVTNADDAISLMQMGANYNKKMAALKPNLKLMKLLENSGLLSEEKIGFLIDLEKKNPEAISKLIKDSGIDPLDLDAEKASGYKPKTYTVDDREIELDTVLDEIQGTPSYTRTLDIVSTKWDGPSKQVIAGSPQLLKVINTHVQSGVYDVILKEVESERMFGRLNGLSDIEAYRQVGDAIQARGGFNSLGHQEKPVAKPAVVVPKPSKVDEEKLREKRRAASSTKPAASSPAIKDYNPLSMSDEEFSKTVNSKYL